MKTSLKIFSTVLAAFLCLGCLQVASAQSVLESQATLLDATIYGRGAVLHHKTPQIQVPAGNAEIVINQIARTIDPQSIRVTGSNTQLTILSASFENDYLNKGDNKSTIYLEIKKKHDAENAVLNNLIAQRKAEEGALALLEENKKFGGQASLTPTAISGMINYYREQYKTLADNITAFKIKEEEQQKVVNKLKSQMNEVGGNEQNSGQLVLRVNSPQGVKSDFNISYFTNNVSWTPFYEIRVEKLNEPLQLVYKAQVVQNTGIDWKQIKLNFASGNPQRNNNAPVLTPWWLSFQRPVVQTMKRQANALVLQEAEMAYYPQEEAVADQNMAQIQNNQLNSAFVINTPYDVYSNGKPQSVQLQTYQLPVIYTYFTAPRSDEQAFLIGKITDWEKLNLLPGNANLLIDNNYGGTSYINPQSTNDTLILSLGRDERIITNRTQIDEEGSTAFIGNSRKRVYTYEISVRNARNEAVDVQVKELYPLSTEKDIEVKLEEVSNAQINSERGELSWKLHLNAGETKKLRISYSIRSPKDKVVVGL